MVFSARPLTDAATATGLVPDPGSAEHGALDPYGIVVPYSNLQSVTFPPAGFTVAFSVAEGCVTAEAAWVATDGAGSVLNVRSRPCFVPPALVAEILRWYSVFARRALSAADTATGFMPDPGFSGLHGANGPYLFVVPYSNSHFVTSPPSGFTVAFSLAAVWVTSDADTVVTPAGLGSV